MATGSPVSFWYGTRAQFDSITTKLDTTLYFITDEQALYKGTVKFSGSGVDTLLTISATEPTASSVTTGDKYFNTTDNLIHVLLNDNGTVSTTATYEPANGALYYNADAQRFQTLIKDGSSYVPTEIYDAGISVEDGTGLVLNGTTVGGLDATTNSKGVVKIGANISVSNGVISVPVATNAVFGVVKSGDNITNTNGVFSVAKATASSLGVVKPGDNINVDNNGQISVPVANGNTKGVVKVSTNIDVADGVISVKDASTSDKGVVQLVNDPSSEDMQSRTKAITPWVVKFMYDDLYTGKQDNISCETPINLDVNRISLAYGDGLAVGVTGTTNANKLIVNEASVKEVLEDVVDGGTEPAVNEIVTADNLKGALSVGQAVDVSCEPYNNSGSISYNEGGFLNGFTANMINGSTVGFYDDSTQFPKLAPHLNYLLIANVAGSGTITLKDDSTVALSETPKRIAIRFDNDNNKTAYFYASGNVTVNVINWRQYEVTALTDEAIAYIAQLENPDEYFRSNTVDTVKNKYLVKNDMVCPWIKTISMPDNSDLTVASGLAYKIKYTNDSPHTITADTIPADAYGQDAHIKMFIKGTSAIHFTEPLVLMNALTPNAGHNLSVKFRDGQAFVYVDDTDAGYVVTVASGNTNGTLNYAITGGTTDYVIFSADLDGTTVDAGTVTFVGTSENTTMNILGNGTDNTTITGTYSVASGKTINFQDLTVTGSTINGAGTINLAGVTIDDVSLAATACSIKGSVFSGNNDVASGATVSFTGVNTLNATLSGAGTMRFINGSTIYSSDGTGVIDISGFSSGSIPLIGSGYDYATFDGLTLTGGHGKDGGFCSTNALGITFKNCTITGNTASNWGSAIYLYGNGQLYLENCLIVDNIGTIGQIMCYNGLPPHALVSIAGSTIGPASGVGVDGTVAYYCYPRSPNYFIKDSVISGMFIRSSLEFVCDIEGMVSLGEVFGAGKNNKTYTGTANFRIKNGSILANTQLNALAANLFPNCIISIGSYNEQAEWIPGGSASFVNASGVTSSVSGCEFYGISYNGVISGDTNIVVAAMDTWVADKAVFASPIDAHKAGTVKLSGTTFTTTAKTLNANRIQLPASTTVSFSGNTNDADTKILDAGLIVVGDNPASPSGSATVVNASGTSSTVTGIGTYIDKEGDNDFVANNTTNVVAVDNSTTGAKYLGTVLSATTGETGANRFAKIDSGAVAVVNEATNAVNKQIITNEYEPIIGGTFSLTSATVNEATKTVAIQSGGTMTLGDAYIPSGSTVGGGSMVVEHVVNSGTMLCSGGIRIENGGTIDGTGIVDMQKTAQIYATFRTINIKGATITGTDFTSSGGVTTSGGSGVANLENVTFTGNKMAYTALNSGILNLSGCVASANTGGLNGGISYIHNNGKLNINGGNILDGKNILRSGSATFAGSNTLLGTVEEYSGNPGTVIISSGAILDLTGNSNPTPIAPGGGITFESGGATVLYSSGAVSGSYMMDNVALPAGAKLTNTAVVDLGGTGSAACYGSASGVTLASGFFGIHSGGVANEPIISSGCSLVVSSGGSALLVTSNTGAIVTVAEGGYITYK